MIICSCCPYKTDRPYNMNRHMVTKHIDVDDTVTTDGNLQLESSFTCDQCSSTFAKRSNLVRHVLTCKGKKLSSLKCRYCMKDFSFTSSKCRHEHVCEHNPCSTQSKGVSIVNNIQNTTTTNTNIQNIQNNNNNINIIVYDPSNLPFLTDHIDLQKLKDILSLDDEKSIVQLYSRELMDRIENQCIRKTNLRASHSQVHVGNNKWQSLLDKELYPKLMCNIADGFSTLLNGKKDEKWAKIQRHVFQKMMPFLDYLSDSGYCNNDEKQKEVLENFNTLVQELKLIAFDLTLQTGKQVNKVI